MPFTECFIGVQTSQRPESGTGTQFAEEYGEYLIILIPALVLGLVVMMFIRTSMRRSAKRHGRTVRGSSGSLRSAARGLQNKPL